ncbi:MAG: hypothetical protein OHK0023_20030 [Anaerolineae bacterium]
MLERYKNLLFLALAAALGAAIFTLLNTRPPAVSITILPPGPTSTAKPIQVYVSGAVVSPKQVQLPAGSRAEDAIRAAGGFAEGADTGAVNLAFLLHDGDQVHVWKMSETNGAVLATRRPSATQTVTQIRINSASAEELELLPGVGPVLAAAIIKHRTEHGRFRTLSDLDAVPGVGPARLQQWATWIIFD